MNNRESEEHCPCGHRLRTVTELDTGLCIACQQRGELPVGESFEWERELKREEDKDGEHYRDDDGSEITWKISHWMPLPQDSSVKESKGSEGMKEPRFRVLCIHCGKPLTYDLIIPGMGTLDVEVRIAWHQCPKIVERERKGAKA